MSKLCFSADRQYVVICYRSICCYGAEWLLIATVHMCCYGAEWQNVAVLWYRITGQRCYNAESAISTRDRIPPPAIGWPDVGFSPLSLQTGRHSCQWSRPGKSDTPTRDVTPLPGLYWIWLGMPLLQYTSAKLLLNVNALLTFTQQRYCNGNAMSVCWSVRLFVCLSNSFSRKPSHIFASNFALIYLTVELFNCFLLTQFSSYFTNMLAME